MRESALVTRRLYPMTRKTDARAPAGHGRIIVGVWLALDRERTTRPPPERTPMTDKTVITLIEEDHRSVAAALDQLASGALSQDIKNEIVRSLAQHSVAEELLIYPRVGDAADDGAHLEEES